MIAAPGKVVETARKRSQAIKARDRKEAKQQEKQQQAKKAAVSSKAKSQAALPSSPTKRPKKLTKKAQLDAETLESFKKAGSQVQGKIYLSIYF